MRPNPTLETGPLAVRRDPTWAPGMLGLGEVTLLGASLARVLARAQPLLPASLARAGEAAKRRVSDAAVADLKTRAQAGLDALTSRADDLEASLAPASPDPAQVGAAVEALAAFGIAVPGPAGGPAVATLALKEARRRSTAAGTAVAGETPFDVDAGIAAGKALFGDAFWMLPVISPAGPDLFAATLGGLDPGQAGLRRFVRDMASVRAGLGRYAESLLFTDALGVSRSLKVAQLAAPGTAGASVWLGGAFDPAAPSPSAPVTCLLVETPDALVGTDSTAGLLLDEWVEVAPTRTLVGSGAGAGPDGGSLETVVTAGLAANVDVPGARAPQALLLAVSPDGSRWSTASLCDVLAETLELARLRAVTLERVALAGRVLPALQEQSWSLQGEVTLDLTTIMTVLSKPELMLQFVKE